ncbi:hypothetical protein [Ramlibacter pallidus]|uniref:Uncharacterized protein n=1 Tax=Ramlibacter pallidus TaxID=2780087 RepID=A0ABR9S4U1_9BURK|nr:hypothetical protein [Ramlibacter pallidus]MBE7368493.1 hypothetical protein [Ramlibacter pallidus]
MNLIASPRFLPAVLWADAASGLATGVLQVAAAPVLAGWLGLPQGLLSASGYALFAYAAFAAWLARGRPVSRGGVVLLVLANLVWVAGCVELLFTGAAATWLGQGWLLVLAVAVGALAALEWAGLRGARRTAWA